MQVAISNTGYNTVFNLEYCVTNVMDCAHAFIHLTTNDCKIANAALNNNHSIMYTSLYQCTECVYSVNTCESYNLNSAQYMIILFVLFLIQFALACACLAVNTEQKENIAKQGWMMASPSTREDVQRNFNCCGYKSPPEKDINTTDPLGFPFCKTVSFVLLLYLTLY